MASSIRARTLAWAFIFFIQVQAQTLILETSHETIHHSGDEESAAAAQDELKYSADGSNYVESVLSFDLSYAREMEHLSSAVLKMYALEGDLTASHVIVHASDHFLESALIDSSSCDSIPCWVEVDLTSMLSSIKQTSELIDINIGISAAEQHHGSFAATAYKGGRYAPKLVMDFQHQALTPAGYTRTGLTAWKGSESQSIKNVNVKQKKVTKKAPSRTKPVQKKVMVVKSQPLNIKPKPITANNNLNKPVKKKVVVKNQVVKKKLQPQTTKVNINQTGVKKVMVTKTQAMKKKPQPINAAGHKLTVPNAFKPNNPVAPNAIKQARPLTPTTPKQKKLVVPNAFKQSRPLAPTALKQNKPRPAKNVVSNSKPKTPAPTPAPTPKPLPASPTQAVVKTLQLLKSNQRNITQDMLMYNDPILGNVPSVYTFSALVDGLGIMSTKGAAGMTFYLGNSEYGNGPMYGLVNIASFLAQSRKETIKYNACDENSYDIIDGRYPLSNACGQLGQSYQDYKCHASEKHMECPVDPNMRIKAMTRANWYGAPAPLFCAPKKHEDDFTGFWDWQHQCHFPWEDPPRYCHDYPNQRAGRFDNTIKSSNSANRTDVEGCCWWGRGVIQTTGVCNFGKLNYYLGSRAAKEGRGSVYPDIDFCKNPEAICSSSKYKELKWIAGMFYWMESLQSYNVRGWKYVNELHAFVDGGMVDPTFIDAVSGIVNRGCHDPPCDSGPIDGGPERAGYFETMISILKS